MSDEDPPDEGPVTDPQELERVMELAAGDVALHGPFFRLLMEARVWIFVPPHPELVSHAPPWLSLGSLGHFAARFCSRDYLHGEQ